MKLEELYRHARPLDFIKSWEGRGPRVLVGDIETFPMLSYHWRMWKQNISPIQVVEDVSMMSFAVKWLEQPDTFYLDMRGAGRKMRDDTRLLRPLHTILSNADMIVAQNGQRFDLPQIKARMVQRAMAPLPPLKVIDTLLLNKKAFAFSSNSLAFLSPKFTDEAKTEHQQFPGFHLWLECLKDNPAAWDECETYNITDITSLEDMYLKQRGWYEGHPNFGPYTTPEEEGKHVCPNCGGNHMRRKGTRETQVGIYARFQCGDCGAWSRGRVLVANRDERSHILMN